MKILFINPRIRDKVKPTTFPTGLGIIAAIMVQKGYDVDVYDENALRPTILEMRRDLLRIKNVDIVALGGLITIYHHIKNLVPKLREIFPSAKIILGGGITVDPEVIFENIPVDFCVHGEAEHNFPELCVAIGEYKKEIMNIKGISYIDHNRDLIVTTESGQLGNDLDQFPMPAYEIFPTEIYFNNNVLKTVHPGMTSAKRCATLIWSRGCPYKCTYCWRMTGRNWRYRSVDLVMEEIKYLRTKYGVDSYLFYDECINANRDKTVEFATKLIERGLVAPWYSHARVNLFDEELAKLLKRSGCVGLNFGIESGSPEILAEMKKRQTPDQASEAIRIAKAVNIRPVCTLMIGMPGETESTIQESVKWIRENRVRHSSFFFVTPYPACELYLQPDTQARIINKYGTKDAFFSVLGDASELTINLTTFTDNKLLALSRRASIKSVGRLRLFYYYLFHPRLWPIFMKKRIKRLFCRLD